MGRTWARCDDPDTNPDAPHCPTHLAEPSRPEMAEASGHDADAKASTRTGDDAGAVADTYAAGGDGRAGCAAPRPAMNTRLYLGIRRPESAPVPPARAVSR